MFRLRRKQWRYVVVLLSLLLIIGMVARRQFFLGVSSVASNNEQINNSDIATGIVSKDSGVLTIWWYKGYVEAEKTYLEKIVSDWERENSKKFQLVFFEQQSMLNKAILDALESNATPDIAITYGQLEALLAWQGKIKDVSSIIEPVESSFPDSDDT